MWTALSALGKRSPVFDLPFAQFLALLQQAFTAVLRRQEAELQDMRSAAASTHLALSCSDDELSVEAVLAGATGAASALQPRAIAVEPEESEDPERATSEHSFAFGSPVRIACFSANVG